VSAISVLLVDRRDEFRITDSAASRSAAVDVIAVRDAEAALSALWTSSATVVGLA
jgi:hypothetical protein